MMKTYIRVQLRKIIAWGIKIKIYQISRHEREARIQERIQCITNGTCSSGYSCRRTRS